MSQTPPLWNLRIKNSYLGILDSPGKKCVSQFFDRYCVLDRMSKKSAKIDTLVAEPLFESQ
jgi:hypothetical protein